PRHGPGGHDPGPCYRGPPAAAVGRDAGLPGEYAALTRFYSTANWQKIAARQLARQPLCQGCPNVVPATMVDHIIPIKAGGAKRDPANLQSLCRDCHAQKTRAEQHGYKWIARKHRGCDVDGAPRLSQENLFIQCDRGAINRCRFWLSDRQAIQGNQGEEAARLP